jgi:site-specific DNA-methyltransferase (adenine-specific)
VVCSLARDCKNRLYFGDNLDILRREVPDASVDLIYLDPPFNSNATYNVLFKEKSGEESAAQITAVEDTWQWSVEAEAVYKEIVTGGSCVRRLGHARAVSDRWQFTSERG